MTKTDLTEAEVDENRHYVVLLGGKEGGIGIRVACGSGEDVLVAQIMGVFIKELEQEMIVDPMKIGPLFVECSKHGQYLGLLQLLQSAPANQSGSYPVSMPLLLVPLHDIEHVLPFRMR